MNWKLLLTSGTAALTIACGSNATVGHDAGPGATDAPSVTDAPLSTDVSNSVDAQPASSDQPAASDAPVTSDAPTAANDAPTAVPLLNDCAAMDYVDRTGGADDRTVTPRGSTSYSPRCMTIRAGQTVTFSMSFAAHPLSAGVPHGSSAGATTPSPILTQRSGSSYAVTFASTGYFPFYCTTHGHLNMAGVVRVSP